MAQLARITENGRLPDTRITVRDILHFLENGRSHDEILELLPISLEQLEAGLTYIAQNREYVDQVHQRIEERNRRGNSPETELKLAESRKRMDQWRRDREAAQALDVKSSDVRDGAAG